MRPDSNGQLDVIVLDLLCNTPFYDLYFVESLARVGVRVRPAVTTYDREPHYFERHGLAVGQGLFDVVARVRLVDERAQRLLKGLQWAVNQAIVAAWVARRPPDILHVQWLAFPSEFPLERWCLRWAQRRGAKIIYTVHNVLPHDRGGRDFEAYRALYQLADGLICHTEETRAVLQNRFAVSPAKLRVIPHGALFLDSRRESRQAARAALGYGESEIVVLSAGLVRPYKGLEFLLDAWKTLTDEQRQTMRLVIAGRPKDARYAARIRARVEELGLQSSVRLHFAYLPEAILARHHVAADILVYPYRDVSQSGALLAGMGFGRPIVASKVGGLQETLQDGQSGLLVEYGDASALAERLRLLAGDLGARERLGTAALLELERHYSWTKIASQTVAFYQDVLLGGGASLRVQEAPCLIRR